jgi:hypothetical protein
MFGDPVEVGRQKKRNVTGKVITINKRACQPLYASAQKAMRKRF